jgi:hypothetical protein
MKLKYRTDLSDDVDHALVDARVRTDLEERVSPKSGFEKRDKSRTLKNGVLKKKNVNAILHSISSGKVK